MPTRARTTAAFAAAIAVAGTSLVATLGAPTAAEAVPGGPSIFGASCSAPSTFAEDNADWRVATTSEGTTIVLDPVAVDWSDEVGNPPGSVTSADLDSNWTELWTPELDANGYETSYGSLYGQTVRFDYLAEGADYDLYFSVVSATGDHYWYVFQDQVQVDEWSTITVPLDVAAPGWHTAFDNDTGPTGAAPTQAELTAALANADRFVVSFEGIEGPDRTYLDNFGLACPPAPAVSLTKSADVDEIDTVGQVVTYAFLVTNTGNTDLSDVAVTEGEFSGAGELSPVTCPAEPAVLAPEESVTCTATYTVVAEDLTGEPLENSATASAAGPAGPVGSEPSTAAIPSVPLPAPSVSLVKTDDAERIETVGQVVTYSFVVTNTGNVDVSDVAVTEGEFSGAGELSPVTCPAEPAVLAPEESVTCTATYTVVAADLSGAALTNTATASATGPEGPIVSAASVAETPSIVPPVVTPAPTPAPSTPPASLPQTGAEPMAGVAVGAAALMLLGGLALVAARARRRGAL